MALMDIFETIRNRRSIRKYTGAPIPCEDLEKIVDAARLAASGNNRQPWEFVVVTEPALLARLRIPPDHWTEKAGAIIAVVMDPESRWWVEDGAAAAQNLLLACSALGYGACWIEGYTRRNEDIIKEVLGIPDNRRLFTLIPIGVPDEQPVKEKKTMQEVLHWQRYSAK
jgi:nitroreductase